MARSPAARAAAVPVPDVDPDHLDEAPNLHAAYPLSGSRIGPAWREAWRALGSGEWVSVRVLCFDVAPRHGLSPTALDTVVRQARRLPPGRRGRLETVRGADGRLAVRRADLPLPPGAFPPPTASAPLPAPQAPVPASIGQRFGTDPGTEMIEA